VEILVLTGVHHPGIGVRDMDAAPRF